MENSKFAYSKLRSRTYSISLLNRDGTILNARACSIVTVVALLLAISRQTIQKYLTNKVHTSKYNYELMLLYLKGYQWQ